MKKRDIQFFIESLSFFMGVGRITDEVASRIARMDKVLWDELEDVLVQEPKADTPCPVEEPKPEPVPELEPAEEPEPEPEKEPQKNIVDTTWLVKDRLECDKCQYKQGDICDYFGKTGKIRGIPVSECEYWKEGRKTFHKVCMICGADFDATGPRVTVCPECKRAIK